MTKQSTEQNGTSKNKVADIGTKKSHLSSIPKETPGTPVIEH